MRQLTNKDGIYLQKEIKTHTHIFYVDTMRLNVECNGIKLDIQPCDMMWHAGLSKKCIAIHKVIGKVWFKRLNNGMGKAMQWYM